MSPRGTSFELERFSVSPVTAGVALLEVEGRLAGAPARARSPRLLVEHDDGARREHAPVEAIAGDEQLLVSFAVPVGDVEAAAFALAVGGLLLDLPAPDPVAGADRTVSLARELNALRRERSTLRAELAAGREAAAGHAAELERVELAAAEREAEAEQAAQAHVAAAERAAQEHVTAADEALARHQAAANQVAIDRVAVAERGAQEREAELVRAAAEREEQLERTAVEHHDELKRAAAQRRGELERAVAELERELAGARVPLPRESAPGSDVDTTLAVALAEADTAERGADGDTLEAAADVDTAAHPPDGDTLEAAADVDTAAHPPDGDTLEAAADIDTAAHPPDGDTSMGAVQVDTAERPSRDGVAKEPPDDTGPIPLRRSPRYVAPSGRDGGVRREPRRAGAGGRPRTPPLTPPPDAAPKLPLGASPRTIALVVLGIAAFLVLLALLGFLL